jgi:uncharacterized protein YeaO (DUF488 family)/catechol 2,3-dioxygenase-like lactoylglutathione lyase family enzyme
LVDRIWPRGLSKAKAGLDLWCKDVAPSTSLRQWYGHEPERFAEFRRRYRAELDEPERASAMQQLRDLAGRQTLTLLTATKNARISEAMVLADLLRAGPEIAGRQDRETPSLSMAGVVVSVRSLKRSLAFYRDLIGIPVLRREERAIMLGPIGKDAIVLTLHQVGEHAIRGLNEIGPRQLWWSVDASGSLDDLADRLTASGQSVYRTVDGDAEILRAKDPDGIVFHVACWPAGTVPGSYEHIPEIVYTRE